MKQTALILLMAASVAASAQTTARHTTAHAAASTAASPKLPPGVKPVKGVVKAAFALKYQDYVIGTGAEAEPNKLYKVHYTGYLASDGKKFDSSYDHPRPPVTDKDGKPVMGADGKPEQGPAQPLQFPQGFGRLIPGWDQGFYGMHIGGKRRLFIPWQLAYGVRGRPGPDADHPGIPPKADLIFDVELVDVTDMPMPPNRPGMPPGMQGRPMPGGMPHPPGTPAPGAAPGTTPATPGTPGQPATPPSTPPPGATGAPATPSAPPQPGQTTPPAQPSTPPQTPPATTPQPQPK